MQTIECLWKRDGACWVYRGDVRILYIEFEFVAEGKIVGFCVFFAAFMDSIWRKAKDKTGTDRKHENKEHMAI